MKTSTVRSLAVALLALHAARATAAPATCRVEIDSPWPADPLAADVRATPIDASACRLTRVDVVDPLADPAALATPATTRPAATDDLVAYVARDDNGDRRTVVVCDARAGTRLAVAVLDGKRDDAARIARAIERAVAKSREAIAVRIALLPTFVAPHVEPTIGSEAEVAIQSTLLARRGVALVELQRRRRFRPAPTLDATPDAGDPLCVVAVDARPTEAIHGATVVDVELSIVTPDALSAKVLTDAYVTEDAVTSPVAAKVRDVPLDAMSTTRPSDAWLADLARDLSRHDNFEGAAALYELAIERAPADLDLRREACAAYLRANGIQPPALPGRARAAVVHVNAIVSSDAAIDRAATRTFAALAHYRAMLDARNPTTRRAAPDDVMRAIFEPPADPTLPPPIGALGPNEGSPRLRQHIAAWRALWLRWADEALRDGRPDADRDLIASAAHATPAERLDLIVSYVAAHRDVPAIRDRLDTYADLFGGKDLVRSPERWRFYDRVATLGADLAEAVRQARVRDEEALERERK